MHKIRSRARRPSLAIIFAEFAEIYTYRRFVPQTTKRYHGQMMTQVSLTSSKRIRFFCLTFFFALLMCRLSETNTCCSNQIISSSFWNGSKSDAQRFRSTSKYISGGSLFAEPGEQLSPVPGIPLCRGRGAVPIIMGKQVGRHPPSARHVISVIDRCLWSVNQCISLRGVEISV